MRAVCLGGLVCGAALHAVFLRGDEIRDGLVYHEGKQGVQDGFYEVERQKGGKD